MKNKVKYAFVIISLISCNVFAFRQCYIGVYVQELSQSPSGNPNIRYFAWTTKEDGTGTKNAAYFGDDNPPNSNTGTALYKLLNYALMLRLPISFFSSNINENNCTYHANNIVLSQPLHKQNNKISVTFHKKAGN